MKLNVNQKKTISSILADLGKLIFVSIVIGKFVSDVKIADWIFITFIIGMLIFFISSLIFLKE